MTCVNKTHNMNELEQRIAASIARNPHRTNAKIADCVRGSTAALVARVRGGMESASTDSPEAATVASVGSGIPLRGMRVLARRPAESAAKHIKRLPKGRGFELKALAREWGMSEETIRGHAKNLNCLRYVEVSEDEWVALVMNPETAQQYTL